VEGEGRREGRGLEPSTKRPESSTNVTLLHGIGWPPEWELIRQVILRSKILIGFHPWIEDLAFWQSQDTYFKREGVQLDQLLEGAEAQMVKEEYQPTSKKAFRQKIANLMRIEARIQSEKKKGRRR